MAYKHAHYQYVYMRGDGHYSKGPVEYLSSMNVARCMAAYFFQKKGWEAQCYWEEGPSVGIYLDGKLKGEVFFDGYKGGYFYEFGDKNVVRPLNPYNGHLIYRARKKSAAEIISE